MRTQENIEALQRILEEEQDNLEADDSEMEDLLPKLFPDLEQRAEQEWIKVKKLAFQMKIAEGQAKSKRMEALSARMRDNLASMPTRTMEVMIATMHAKGVAVQYNKLEEWNVESIQEIFEDFELLEMLEALEKED